MENGCQKWGRSIWTWEYSLESGWIIEKITLSYIKFERAKEFEYWDEDDELFS